MEAEHSRLLKFFKETCRDKPKMAEAPVIPVIKIEKEYQNPPSVEAEVPGTHEIRDFDDKKNSSEIPDAEDDKNNSSEIKMTGADFTLSPVITVTKNESSLTKGDMKLQKVTVTEDIAEEELKNGGYKISREVETLTQTNRQPGSRTVERSKTRREEIVTEKMEGEEKSQDEKKSKIPLLRLKQAVERVKKERQAQQAREQPRRSSIPKLKDAKKVIKRDTSLNFTPQVDDEFDKLYEEIVDNNQKNIDEKLPSVTSMEDPEKIETKFEEIIHAYDEDEHAKQPVSRVSKIPSLRRKDDEGPSRLGALIDRAKEKSTITESKLKDGGFKVTASTIKTKRFSRGNSRDLSTEQHIEVTETIDIRESGDNDVFVKEIVIKKTAPDKPERNFRNITKRVVADNKAGTVENIEGGGTQTTVRENLDKKDGTLNKTKRFNRTVSKETRERNLNRELSKNLENVRREFRNKIEDSRLDDEFNNVDNNVIATETITKKAEATPIKTEIIVRGVSKEINKDGQNMNSEETVTVEELEDGGTRTITTKTTETLVIGAPVVTEKVIRNISRNISSEGQNNTIKGVTTIEESTDGGSKKVTKETYVRENKGIPVKTERFTRGISREMGNIRQRSSSREIVTAVENSNLGTEALKKESKKTEQTQKEGSKGIPVYTKVTRSFSKGKIQNVEMSRSIEWKHADEVKTKNFSRSVSEKVTQKELKDAGKGKHGAQVTDENDKPTEQSNITCTQNKTPKNPVLESIIKDTVKKTANKITTNKVAEYKSEEQVTNVEKTTYVLSSDLDLTVDSNFKACREIGTQMSIDGKPIDRNFKFVKEIGTQMSVEGKPLDSPFDRDFKLAKERNLKAKSKIAGTTINGDGKTSKEFGTQMRTVEKTISSSFDGTPKVSREFGTQMSVVGNIVDRDIKISKEIGTQMSFEGTKQIQENHSAKPSNANVTEINKDSSITEKCEKEYSKLSTLDKNRDIAETTVLKGNISRIKDKIAKETVVVSNKGPDEGLPNKKSVLSKIAIFERQELKDPHPVIEESTRRIKCKYVPPNLNRINSADRPKIVDEVLKENIQSEPLGDTSKVEIGVYYDEVTYTSKPVVGKKYLRTEEGYEEKISDIKQVNVETKEVTSAHSQQETNDSKMATIRPGTTDFKTQVSQIEFVKTRDDKTQMQRELSVIEMPIIIPAKINYEADIGKTKPGKINLNSWSTQVEINKSTVDKIDFLREESLQDIAQTLPGKVDFKTSEGQVPVSRDLPGIIDFKQEENQIESVTILPGKINVESKEVVQTLAGRIDNKTNDSRNGESDNLPGITHGYLVDDVTTLPAKIDFKSYEIHTEIATTLPGKTEINSNQTEFTNTLTAFGYTSVEKQPKDKSQTSLKKVSTKPKPGKINLNLWQNQVDTNKTLVGKTGIIRKSKEAEMVKALSGRPNFNNKPVRLTDTVQGNNVLNRREYKTEIAKTTTGQIDINPPRDQVKEANTLRGKNEFDSTENQGDVAKALLGNVRFSSNETQEATIRTLPETVNFSTTSSQAEVATTLPGTIDFSSSEEPKILTGKIEFETDFITNESKAEISENLQDNIYFGSTDNQTENITTLSGHTSVEKVGKLDLKTWELQVEVNKTLVDKLDVVKGEYLEDIAKTLPAKIDFITYESHVGEAKTFQKPINTNTEEHKVEITEIEADENEVPKILPGVIEFDPFKHTPRFNPLPMLMRPNSQDNKVLGKETGQSNDLKDNIYKVEMPIESNPGETFSDPELVDEDPAVEAKSNNDSIIGSIKRKLYFISNKSSVQDATNTPMNTPVPVATDDDNDYEKRVDEIQKKTYSISNIVHKTNEAKTVSSMTSITTGKPYEITTETIAESYLYNVTDNTMSNSTTEYELSSDTSTVQNKLTKDADDFKTSPAGDYKHLETNENGFNFNVTKVTNELTRSADAFKTSKEELTRAKSLAELDLGDAVHGQVRRMVGRIKSVDFARRESVKTEINIKEMPKKLSVWEKIALFEGKTASSKWQSTTTPTTVTKETNPTITEQTRSSCQSTTTPTTDTKGTKPTLTEETSSSCQSTTFLTTIIKETNPTITEEKSSSCQSTTTPTTDTKVTNPTLTEETSSSCQSTTTLTNIIKETNPTITEVTYLKKIDDLNRAKNTFGKIDNMLHLPLADGSQIPVLALGTALMDPRLLPHQIGAAIDMGYRAIDTGYIYGNEKEIGDGIKAKIDDGTVKREDLYIMSKLWSTFHRPDLVEVACNASLKTMGLDYFDLYMIHNPMSFKEGPDPIPKIGTVLQYSQYDYLDAWSGMEGLVTKGLVKSIGVSNFNSQQIQSILDKGGRKPVVNQVECHPYLTQQPLHNFCVEHNIKRSCFGVLGSKGTPAEYKNSTTAVIDDPLVKTIADDLGVTPAQLLIRYQIESGHSVVVKASTAAHLWDNLQALNFSLNQTQMLRLSALNRNKRTFVFTGMGDTHKNYPF